MSLHLYAVATERFGSIQVERENIAEARRWAREALGIRNPDCVSRIVEYQLCECCGSRPCTCSAS
jgi:hypothetical protein